LDLPLPPVIALDETVFVGDAELPVFIFGIKSDHKTRTKICLDVQSGSGARLDVAVVTTQKAVDEYMACLRNPLVSRINPSNVFSAVNVTQHHMHAWHADERFYLIVRPHRSMLESLITSNKQAAYVRLTIQGSLFDVLSGVYAGASVDCVKSAPRRERAARAEDWNNRRRGLNDFLSDMLS
jgi:hypothetical protein